MSSVPTEHYDSQHRGPTSTDEKGLPANGPSEPLARDLRDQSPHLEQLLLRADKLASLGLLACGAAHEISNPLAGVQACVRALRTGQLSPDKREAYFDTISEALMRIAQTVHSLLHFGRDHAAVRTRIDLAEVVIPSLRLVRSLLAGKDLSVDNHVRPGAAHTIGDPSQLSQALVNVLINAAHASPAQGHIAIDTVRDGSRVGLCVTDQGPGIPPELRAQVCDPFFTTKPEDQGTGLGLAITQTIVRRHGGSLQIGAGEDGGARVTLWLLQAAQRA